MSKQVKSITLKSGNKVKCIICEWNKRIRIVNSAASGALRDEGVGAKHTCVPILIPGLTLERCIYLYMYPINIDDLIQRLKSRVDSIIELLSSTRNYLSSLFGSYSTGLNVRYLDAIKDYSRNIKKIDFIKSVLDRMMMEIVGNQSRFVKIKLELINLIKISDIPKYRECKIRHDSKLLAIRTSITYVNNYIIKVVESLNEFE